MRIIDCLEVTGTSRGGVPNKSWIETVRNDVKALIITDKIVLGRTEWNRKVSHTSINWDSGLMMVMSMTMMMTAI